MSNNDNKIKSLLSKVESQQIALATKPKVSWLTNAIFKYTDTNFFNLNTVKEPQILVEALSFLLEKETTLAHAATLLGVDVKPLMWQGYAVSDWQADFKKRIDIIKWEEKKTQLEAMKKKLSSLVSEETKTEMELSVIESML